MIRVFLLIALIPIFINFYVIYNNINDIFNIKDVDKNYDIALILGCSVLNNERPSKMLRDRLDKGIELYTNGLVSKILISGDHQKEYSEVEVMYKYLLNENINEEDILIYYEGYSTSDSLINFKNNYSDSSVIIVTQKYHLYRSLNIAKKLDLNAIGVHTNLINYHGFIFREIREILARNKDFVKFLCY